MGVTRKIFMAVANHWTSPFQVGSHHLARGFVKAGWKVAFVSDPISPWHILGGNTAELKDRFACYRTGGKYYLDRHLWAYVPAALFVPHNKPLLRAGWVARHWASLSWPHVISRAVKNGFASVDLLYFDSAAQSFWLYAIRHKKSVFRIADNNSGFEKSTPTLQKLESTLAQSVDLVVYTAESLKEHVEAMQPKRMLHLPNGVDFPHFASGPIALPPEYPSIPRPIAVYVGSINVWFDYELLYQAAQRLPQISFVLIGPERLAHRNLRPFPNIHVLGSRPYAALPAYLHNADVGIIPFDVKKYPNLIHSVNPLKLYEYMACGLPVVATRWREIERLNSPALLCGSEEEFIAGITRSVLCPHRDANVRYAAQQNWENRICTLTAQIEDQG